MRPKHGNMTVFIAACAILLVPLIWFAVNFSRLLGGNAQQKTAIEAAALAAAEDIGRIVVDTPQFGLVSVSDYAPAEQAGSTSTNLAGDNYCVPVHSINTIIGTARLNLIIANQINGGDSTMATLAEQDLADAQTVIQSYLTPVYTAAVQGSGVSIPAPPQPPGWTGSWPPADWPNNTSNLKDIHGNPILVYQDAENAYKQNEVRMTGASSYVAGSLQLTMGYLTKGVPTNTPIPQPSSFASDLGPGHLQLSNCYISDTNIPVTDPNGDDINFVFGAIGAATSIVDLKTFRPSTATSSTVAYTVPVVVRADADHWVKTTQTNQGQTYHEAAGARPASIYDPRPAPGAFVVSFPDGSPSTNQFPMDRPSDLLGSGGAFNHKMTYHTAVDGDFPTDTGSSLGNTQLPYANPTSQSTIGKTIKLVIHDWLNRGGVRVNVQAVADMFSTTNASSAFLGGAPVRNWVGGITPASAAYPPSTPYSLPNWADITATWAGPQIPVGICHIYEFKQDGTINYYFNYITPYQYSVLSQSELYAEAVDGDGIDSHLPSLTFDHIPLPADLGRDRDAGTGGGGTAPPVGDLKLDRHFDLYIRDQVRWTGPLAGGKHAGEPLPNPITGSPTGTATHITWAPKTLFQPRCGYICTELGGNGYGAKHSGGGGPGGGNIPLIGSQDDFNISLLGNPSGTPPIANLDPSFSNYIKYGPSSGSHTRPTYQVNGCAVEIRFRRVLKLNGAWNGVAYLVSDDGYLGAQPPYP